MIGSFSQESMEAFAAMVGEENFSESLFDFTTCERPNGSLYGTGGRCRKGTETTSQGAGYAPRSGERKPENAVDALKQKILGGGQVNLNGLGFDNEKQIRVAYRSEPEKMQKALEAHRANKKFAADLKKELPREVGARVDSSTGAVIMTRKVGGHSVEVEFSPQLGFNYRVDGEYDAGKVTDRKEQLRVANAVRQMWDSTVRALPEGTPVWTSAYDGDKYADKRVKAYRAAGFGDPNSSKEMRSVKRNGRMIPLNEGDEIPKDTISFSEQESLKSWFEILFPDPGLQTVTARYNSPLKAVKTPNPLS